MIPRSRTAKRYLARSVFGTLFMAATVPGAFAQTSYSWDQVKARFEATNPALKADADNVDEMRAEEITAYLRPNPQFTVSGRRHADRSRMTASGSRFRARIVVPSVSYLHERDHKRELRLESAQEGTRISESEHEDLKRTLEFTLRAAFVQTLEAKAVLELAQADLDYYDKIIDISRDRFKAGDIAQIDFDRIELLRVQYESELQTAIVNLRTAKIQLLQLLNDRTPVEQFDVTGPFDFSDALAAARRLPPDRRSTRGPICRRRCRPFSSRRPTTSWPIANGSTDPTFGAWYTWNSSNNNPEWDPDARRQREHSAAHLRPQPGREAAHADRHRPQPAGQRGRARAGLQRRGHGLRAGREQHRAAEALQGANTTTQALRVRDTVTYSYQHGGASLMDFLNAQSDYRQVQLAYAQLIGAYLTAAGTTESCRRTRGNPMTNASTCKAVAASPHALRWPAAERSSTQRAARPRRRRWSRPAMRHWSPSTTRSSFRSWPRASIDEPDKLKCDRLGLSRHLARGSRHLAGQRPRGRYPGAARRQREEGPAAFQRAKPRHHQCIRYVSEGRERRAARQQGVHARQGPVHSTAPFRSPCWSRPRIRRKTPRPI